MNPDRIDPSDRLAWAKVALADVKDDLAHDATTPTLFEDCARRLDDVELGLAAIRAEITT